uniref:Uncharacterized protein n=1 Tax=Onchocerca volvulus TaxID=6282 RepID=A0A8R1TMH3_ONCVO
MRAEQCASTHGHGCRKATGLSTPQGTTHKQRQQRLQNVDPTDASPSQQAMYPGIWTTGPQQVGVTAAVSIWTVITSYWCRKPVIIIISYGAGQPDISRTRHTYHDI